LESGEEYSEVSESSTGRFIRHADLIEIFAWMVTHQATFRRGYFDWFDGKGWLHQGVPDGDFLAAIVELMGGDDE